jgi:kynureninase
VDRVAETLTAEAARQLDEADPLRAFRARFRLPEGVVYLDGNSLGPLPRATPARLLDVAEREWGESLIAGWTAHRWIEAPARVGALIAPLVGACADELIVADSTSINLAKLVLAALALRPGRRVVLAEAGDFPTDRYMVEGLASLGLCVLRTVPREAVAEALDGETALLLLSHVHYRRSARHDMAALTAAAHAAGALTLWDVSHSAGAIEVNLAGAGADFATGCGYKYLNGGPGAPAFLFAARHHHDAIRQPLSGWMGHAAPFAFEDGYRPAPGMARFLAGTPPVLGLAALEEGVRLVAEAGIAALEAKSRLLSQALIACVEAAGAGHGLVLASPREPGARGSHVAFAHPHAHAICQALIAGGVIGDFRAPDVLRFGLAPAFLSFEDVRCAAATLARILDTRSWDRPAFHARKAVT